MSNPPHQDPPTRRFSFPCVRCGSYLEATDDLSGRPGRCPTCGEMLTIPPLDLLTGLPEKTPGIMHARVPRTPLHAYGNAGDSAPRVRRNSSGEQVIVCPRCNHEWPTDADVCGSCHLPFTLDGAAAPLVHSGTRDLILSCAALAFGLLSLPLAHWLFVGPTAMILAFAALRRTSPARPDGMTKWCARLGFLVGGLSIAYSLSDLFDLF